MQHRQALHQEVQGPGRTSPSRHRTGKCRVRRSGTCRSQHRCGRNRSCRTGSGQQLRVTSRHRNGTPFLEALMKRALETGYERGEREGEAGVPEGTRLPRSEEGRPSVEDLPLPDFPFLPGVRVGVSQIRSSNTQMQLQATAKQGEKTSRERLHPLIGDCQIPKNLTSPDWNLITESTWFTQK